MTDIDNDLPEIPFRFVGRELKIQLANKLDPMSHVTGNDWRLLAEKLGYTADEIQVLEEQRHGGECRSTLKLFSEYLRVSGNSVNKVIAALREMNRKDALTILLDNLPQIRKNCAEEEKRKMKMPEEHSYTSFDHYPSMFNSNMYMPHHNPTMSPHGPYLPCVLIAQHPMYGFPSNASYNNQRLPDNSPPIHRPVKKGKVHHHGDMHHGHSWGRSSPCENGMPHPPPAHSHAFSHTHKKNGRLFSESSVNGFDSMEVNYSQYPSREQNISLQDDCNENNNLPDEAPADLARTILRGQGHMVSLSNTPAPLPVSHPEDYHGDVSSDSDDSLSSDPEISHGGPRRRRVNHEQRRKRNSREEAKNPPQEDLNCNNARRRNASNKDPKFGKSGQGHGSAMKVEPQQHYPDSCREENYSFRLPQRSKSHSNGNSQTRVDKDVHEISGSLRKSLSLPGNMKPAVEVYSKVFVTYSYESERHFNRVFTLCDCLCKNKFKVYADIYKKPGDISSNDKNKELCRTKFLEADFVLVCPSKKYRSNISERNQSDTDANGLHTKFIYQLMHEEYTRNDYNNKRFVPVILEGTSHDDLPSWLQHGTVKYMWPSQYKDLLWMLTKPEQRISRHGNRKN